ncbi:MAG: aminoacyl-tRNA hydrolase [Anaeroplasmataceae bacterium]|nr:aminoacyl-tRNA hydrolase [Anaeroplasmataceae bacterium]
MKLIVGLGNPGAQYEQTRHNVGFMAIDTFANEHNAIFRLEPKLKGMLASVTLNGTKAFLLKPMTFMNLSGESVKAVKDYYKIAIEDILIISDDLDSHNGRVRLRAEGSAGGHNGHKNIIAHLGTEEYKRIKIGIGRSEVIPVIDWVLQKFNKDELAEIEPALTKAKSAIEDFISGVPFNKISSLYSCK